MHHGYWSHGGHPLWTEWHDWIHYITASSLPNSNKNAFQWDAYRPRVDRIPACTAQERSVCRGLSVLGVSARGVCIPACNRADTPPLWSDRQLRKHNLRKLRLRAVIIPDLWFLSIPISILHRLGPTIVLLELQPMDSLDTIRTLSRLCVFKELRGTSPILYLYGNEFDKIIFTSLVMKHQLDNGVLKPSLGLGNVFTPVCQSFRHPPLGKHPAGQTPAWTDISLDTSPLGNTLKYCFNFSEDKQKLECQNVLINNISETVMSVTQTFLCFSRYSDIILWINPAVIWMRSGCVV